MLEAFPFDTAPRHLLRDRDRIYGQKFRDQLALMNINEVLSAPRSPWQRAYVERVIGSIHRECLDHVIVFNEESLRGTLRSYFSYYHRSRLHLSIGQNSAGPEPRPTHARRRIVFYPTYVRIIGAVFLTPLCNQGCCRICLGTSSERRDGERASVQRLAG